MKKLFLYSASLTVLLQSLCTFSQSMSNSQFSVNGDPIPSSSSGYHLQRQNPAKNSNSNTVSQEEYKEQKGLFSRFKKKNTKQEAKQETKSESK